jgi:broad specificity phosphatase PhoE
MPSAIATVAPLFTHDDIDADMQYCNWLREVDTGDWEGLSHGQASDRDPVAMENYLRDPGQHQFPRGEHLLAAYERATVAFRELICRERKQSSRIVLVGHAMINRLLLTDYCGATLLEHRHIDQVAGNFTVLRYAFGETELQAIGAAVV